APWIASRAASISPLVSVPSRSTSRPATSPMSSLRAKISSARTSLPEAAYSPLERPTSCAPARPATRMAAASAASAAGSPLCIISGAKLADEIARGDLSLGAVGREPVDHLHGSGGVGEAGGADLHGGRASEEELDHVVGGRDASDPDHGDG